MSAETPPSCRECGGDPWSGHSANCSQCECKVCGDVGELLSLVTGRWVPCIACKDVHERDYEVHGAGPER